MKHSLNWIDRKNPDRVPIKVKFCPQCGTPLLARPGCERPFCAQCGIVIDVGINGDDAGDYTVLEIYGRIYMANVEGRGWALMPSETIDLKVVAAANPDVAIYLVLQRMGAEPQSIMSYEDLRELTDLPIAQIETVLVELCTLGLIPCTRFLKGSCI